MKRIAALAFLLALFQVCAVAQTSPNLEQGLKPFGSYSGGEIDSVSIPTGNLTLHAPLWTPYPQRGSLFWNFNIVHNGKGWYVFEDCNPATGECDYEWRPVAGDEGVAIVGPLNLSARATFVHHPTWGNIWSATTSDGSVHQMWGLRTIDGTGIVTDGVIGNTKTTIRTGVKTLGSDIIDPNGNKITGSGPLDTTNKVLQTVVSAPDFDGCAGPRPTFTAHIIEFPGQGGTPRKVKVCKADVALRTNFQSWTRDQSEQIAEEVTSRVKVQSIVLFNGTNWSTSPKWVFEYGDTTPGAINYGDLTKVTLPTGGTISYTWDTHDNCGEGMTTMSRWVTSRTVNDGGGDKVWSYIRSGGSLTSPFSNPTTTVRDPAGNDTVHVIDGLNNSCSAYVIQVRQYKGQQVELLKTVDTEYSFLPQPHPLNVAGDGTPLVVNVFPTRVTTTIHNGTASLASKVETVYDSAWGSGYSQGNVMETREYDFGAPSSTPIPGPLVRRTVNSYKSHPAGVYRTNNLLDLIDTTTVFDGAGNKVVETKYAYDEYTLSTSGITTQRDTSVPNVGRGNRTSTSRWLTGTTYLTTTTKYFDTGMPSEVIDPAGHSTTMSYSSTFAGALLTQTNMPATGSVSHIVSGNYDANTGQLISFTDQNGAPTTSTFTYDIFGRILTANFPDQGQTEFIYQDTPGALQVTKKVKRNTAGDKIETKVLFDGLGRPKQNQAITPEGTVLVDTTYDSLGRVWKVTNPHLTTGDLTFGTTETLYDALGRVEKVIPPDGTASTNRVLTEYFGNSVKVTDQAGKARISHSDALGRLIRVDEPGKTAGSVDITGNERSTQVQTAPATSGTGSVTINSFNANGSVRREEQWDCPGTPPCYIYDNGSVWITVNGFTASVNYSGTLNSNRTAVATALKNALNVPASPVTATSTSNVVYITAKATGAASNYSLSAGTNWFNYFSSPSFPPAPSGATLTGGADPVFTTVWDTGNVSVTVNGFSKQVSYGQGSTGGSIASALASAFQGDVNSPVNASSNGITLSLVSKQVGLGADLSLSASSATTNTTHFTGTSFPPVTSGSNLMSPMTLYTYDALDNLLCVEQRGTVAGTGCASPPSSDATSPWRVRRFSYDPLSRLLSASNPESGTITYQYDADGNLTKKISPAPNQLSPSTATQTISYCYDELHRLTKKFLSDVACPGGAADVAYTYDQGTNGIGRRTGMTDASGSALWTYNVMGQPLSEQRTITGVSKTIEYTYNLDGSIATIKYPSTRTITYEYNNAGQAVSARDLGNSVDYVTNAKYSPFGSLCSLMNGANITSTFTFNQRLQPKRIHATTSGAPAPCGTISQTGTILDLEYDFSLGVQNNGNAMSITNHRDTNRSQSFTYDALNRLETAQTTSNQWGNSYVYDIWGNLLQKNMIPGKLQGEGLTVTVNKKNQMETNHCYDIAGNLVKQAVCPANPLAIDYTYDAENRLKTAGGVTYIYDGDGKRVKKSSGTLYWTGMGSEPFTETDAAGNNPTEYIFFNGKRKARRDANAAVHYYFSDHLGSSSIVTDAIGSITPCPSPSGPLSGEDESGYYPFGGERIVCDRLADQNYKFTGKERDSETGLDLMGARFYSSALGRFTKPDPLVIQKQKLADPQQWNMYQYARNNPLRFVDPTGEAVRLSDDEKEREKQLAAAQQAVGKQAGQYLYINKDKDGHYYLGVYTRGPDGKGPDFASLNAVTEKMNGIIQDTRIVTLQYRAPDGEGGTFGSLSEDKNPAYLWATPRHAFITITSGDIGMQRAELQSNGREYAMTPGDVLSHEFGHLDAIWYHGANPISVAGDPIARGDAVRIENQTRQLNGAPLRLGHEKPGDVQLSGVPF